jgi:hypothetical protein
LKEWGVDPLPNPHILAPRVAVLKTADHPVLGSEAIEELVLRVDREPLPMTLDLQDPAQRAYLRNRGIL